MAYARRKRVVKSAERFMIGDTVTTNKGTHKFVVFYLMTRAIRQRIHNRRQVYHFIGEQHSQHVIRYPWELFSTRMVLIEKSILEFDSNKRDLVQLIH